ncbi:MAG: amidase [Mesorhizobium sp.]
MTRQPTLDTISQLSARLGANEVSPVELLEESLGAIARLDSETHAFITVLEPSARAEAEAAQRRALAGGRLGPLDGVPISIKDILATKEGPTTAGSPILENHMAGYDAPLVARLRAAGAVIVGKNNMHEFAFGVSSANRRFGAVRNPRAPDRIPGGSSGGTAAAIAGGMVCAGIGSDTGGSIRIPAACCELVGLKPTFGLIDTAGAIPQAWSLDHLGPLARCVDDISLLLEAATGTAIFPGAPLAALNGLRVGVPYSLVERADTATRTAFDKAMRLFQDNGAVVRKFDYPDLDEAYRAWLLIMLAESATYHRSNLRDAPDLIDPDIRPFLLTGTCLDGWEYLDAQRYRRQWCARLLQELDGFDVIANPTLPVAPPLRDAETVPGGQGEMPVRDAMVLYQWVANLTGWPSIALPCARDGDSVASSLMLTSRPCSDASLVQIAGLFEQARGPLAGG